MNLSTDGRNCTFKFQGEKLNGKLVDLPCIIESYKTLDKSNYYKSGDIGQMFLFPEEGENLDNAMENFKLNSGITPPTRNIRKRKFRRFPETRVI